MLISIYSHCTQGEPTLVEAVNPPIRDFLEGAITVAIALKNLSCRLWFSRKITFVFTLTGTPFQSYAPGLHVVMLHSHPLTKEFGQLSDKLPWTNKMCESSFTRSISKNLMSIHSLEVMNIRDTEAKYWWLFGTRNLEKNWRNTQCSIYT